MLKKIVSTQVVSLNPHQVRISFPDSQGRSAGFVKTQLEQEGIMFKHQLGDRMATFDLTGNRKSIDEALWRIGNHLEEWEDWMKIWLPVGKDMAAKLFDVLNERSHILGFIDKETVEKQNYFTMVYHSDETRGVMRMYAEAMTVMALENIHTNVGNEMVKTHLLVESNDFPQIENDAQRLVDLTLSKVQVSPAGKYIHINLEGTNNEVTKIRQLLISKFHKQDIDVALRFELRTHLTAPTLEDLNDDLLDSGIWPYVSDKGYTLIVQATTPEKLEQAYQLISERFADNIVSPSLKNVVSPKPEEITAEEQAGALERFRESKGYTTQLSETVAVKVAASPAIPVSFSFLDTFGYLARDIKNLKVDSSVKIELDRADNDRTSRLWISGPFHEAKRAQEMILQYLSEKGRSLSIGANLKKALERYEVDELGRMAKEMGYAVNYDAKKLTIEVFAAPNIVQKRFDNVMNIVTDRAQMDLARSTKTFTVKEDVFRVIANDIDTSTFGVKGLSATLVLPPSDNPLAEIYKTKNAGKLKLTFSATPSALNELAIKLEAIGNEVAYEDDISLKATHWEKIQPTLGRFKVKITSEKYSVPTYVLFKLEGAKSEVDKLFRHIRGLERKYDDEDFRLHHQQLREQKLAHMQSQTIYISPESVGALLGKNGSNIKDIQDVWRVKIDIDRSESARKNGLVPVTIRGTDSVRAAVIRGIGETMSWWDQESVESGTANAVSTSTLQALVADAQQRQSIKKVEIMFLPSSSIGALIGKGGSNIRQLQQETGASINVSESRDRHDRDERREVTIAGSAESVEKAMERIGFFSKQQESSTRDRQVLISKDSRGNVSVGIKDTRTIDELLFQEHRASTSGLGEVVGSQTFKADPVWLSKKVIVDFEKSSGAKIYWVSNNKVRVEGTLAQRLIAKKHLDAFSK